MLKFEKVSNKQYQSDLSNLLVPYLSYSYDCVKLPTRATEKSSGYDFYAPFDFNLEVGESITIPTGIRMITDKYVWLLCMPRSGLGCKFRMQLDNTVGNVDGDYWKADNEGHIFAKITNDGKEGKPLIIKCGDRFMQGVILPFATTDDDEATGTRTGGHGSTGS